MPSQMRRRYRCSRLRQYRLQDRQVYQEEQGRDQLQVKVNIRLGLGLGRV